MKINKNSIRFKIIIPVSVFIIFLMASLICIAHKAAQDVQEDYHRFVMSGHSSAIHKILDTAVTELTTTQLLGEDVVIEAKKKTVLSEVASYLTKNSLEGYIAGDDGREVFSALTHNKQADVIPHLSGKGPFHIERGIYHIHGYVVDFPLWKWKIAFLNTPQSRYSYQYKKGLSLLLPVMALGFVLMLSAILIVLNRNLKSPLDRIIDDITSGLPARTTGIAELDTVGSSINEAFERLKRRTEQYQALHSIALSLNKSFSQEEFLSLVIEKVRSLLKAEMAMIATYDGKGRFSRIIRMNTGTQLPDIWTAGGKLSEVMSIAPLPMRIDNLYEHPVLGASFPEGHTVINNMLAYPILTDEKKLAGVIYLANKEGGFTEDDEDMLSAIVADVAFALSRTEKVAELKRFKQVIESAFDVIVVTDHEGRITYANPAFEEVTGYSVSEAAGMKISMLKSGYHDDAFYKDLWTKITSGKVWRGEFVNRKKNGEIYYASAVITPVRTCGELQFVAIQRDITQEKRLYEQLLRAQKMEAIGTLAGGIAHDFNNLLTAILGYSEMLVSEMNEGDRHYRPLTVIKGAAEKGAELARSILNVSRKERLELKPVNLNNVIHNTVELLSRSIPKHIEIRLKLNDKLPLINADATQIQQVIINLAVNARDAMPDGGVMTISTSMVGNEDGASSGTGINGTSGYLRLTVSDTGCGIDFETQRRIFDPFFTTKEGKKGTGLGLYIVHSIITNHGGYINLHSEPWKGTRFNIYLPPTEAEMIEEPAVEIDLSGRGTILIIDDEESVRELAQDILMPLGYKVITAENGADGIKSFREHPDGYDLVILDIIMPKMGGAEVFRALKSVSPGVRVLLCSGYSHDGFVEIDEMLKQGAAGFMQKPFTRRTIGLAVKKALEQ